MYKLACCAHRAPTRRRRLGSTRASHLIGLPDSDAVSRPCSQLRLRSPLTAAALLGLHRRRHGTRLRAPIPPLPLRPIKARRSSPLALGVRARRIIHVAKFVASSASARQRGRSIEEATVVTQLTAQAVVAAATRLDPAAASCRRRRQRRSQ
ncbi:unnamed protein product [Lampetra planeri]